MINSIKQLDLPECFTPDIARQMTAALKQNSEIITELKATVNEQAKTIASLQSQVDAYAKMQFGPRRERFVEENPNQGIFNFDIDQEAPEVEAEPDSEEEPAKPRRKKKKRTRAEILPENLPKAEPIVIEASEKDKEGRELIGHEEVLKIAYKPGYYFAQPFHYEKWADPKDATKGVKRAAAPDFFIPGSNYDESLNAEIVYRRTVLHLPFYRQEEDAKLTGIEMSRQTMNRLYLKSAENLLPLYELMKQEVLNRNIIFTDDTPVKMQTALKIGLKEGRIWVYVGGGSGPPIIIYEFTPGRDSKYPKEFLKDFRGYIHADAFPGYDKIFAQEGVYECACWMHIRRKFFEAKDAPVELRHRVLAMIRKIYLYERLIKDKDENTILAVREKKVTPLIEEILRVTSEALIAGDVMSSSKFGAAIGYLHNLGQAVKTFVTHPQLKPDNGASERALRPLSIGRKNWLYAGNQRGGQATAILLSLTQSCRALGINPREYLEDVMRRINGHPHKQLAELLPHNWKKADSYYG